MSDNTKERPILFSAPMVRAILDDSKTKTRRLVKDQSAFAVMDGELCAWTGFMGWQSAEAALDPENAGLNTNPAIRCPYGKPGDVLWVREAWTSGYRDGTWGTIFRVDGSFSLGKRSHSIGPHFHAKEIGEHIRWRPSIHMPRWASRITLSITDVRVERLQDISEEDARAEGWQKRPEVSGDPEVHRDAARDWFQDLWGSIHSHDSWQENPWVWVVAFRREYAGVEVETAASV